MSQTTADSGLQLPHISMQCRFFERSSLEQLGQPQSQYYVTETPFYSCASVTQILSNSWWVWRPRTRVPNTAIHRRSGCTFIIRNIISYVPSTLPSALKINLKFLAILTISVCQVRTRCKPFIRWTLWLRRIRARYVRLSSFVRARLRGVPEIFVAA